jgi:hypothetical protein
LSAERKNGRIGSFAVRFWLVAALIVLISALILGANLALLGYAQPGNDPVGQLTPARLMQIERELPGNSHTGTTTVTTPPPHVKHIAGEHSDD